MSEQNDLEEFIRSAVYYDSADEIIERVQKIVKERDTYKLFAEVCQAALDKATDAGDKLAEEVKKLIAERDGKCGFCMTAQKDMLTEDFCMACQRDSAIEAAKWMYANASRNTTWRCTAVLRWPWLEATQ